MTPSMCASTTLPQDAPDPVCEVCAGERHVERSLRGPGDPDAWLAPCPECNDGEDG